MTRQRYFDAITDEHLRSQMQLLRENGYTNRQISDILHVSTGHVIRLVGPMPKQLRSKVQLEAAAKRPKLRKYKTVEERDAAQKERTRRYHKDHVEPAYKKPDDEETKMLELVLGFEEPHGSATETMIHFARDIELAARDSFDHTEVRWVDDGLRIRQLESDDTVWQDEEEPLPPEPKSKKYYEIYSAKIRKLRREQETFKRRDGRYNVRIASLDRPATVDLFVLGLEID